MYDVRGVSTNSEMLQDAYDNAAFDSDDDDWDSRGKKRTGSKRGDSSLAKGRPRRTTAAGARRGRYEADSGLDSRGEEAVLPQLSRMGFTSYGGAYKDEHLLRSLDEITTSVRFFTILYIFATLTSHKHHPPLQNNPNAIIPGSKMTEAEFNSLPIEEQRKQRRLIRNRLSAHLHRQRQKAHIEALETQVIEMATIIEEFKARVQHLVRVNGNINLPPVAIKGTPVDAQTPRPLFPHNLLAYRPPHIPGLLGFSNEVSTNSGLIRATVLHGILYPHNASTSLVPNFLPGGDMEIGNGDINAARTAIAEMFATQDPVYYHQTVHMHHPTVNNGHPTPGNYLAPDAAQEYQQPDGEQEAQNASEYEEGDEQYYHNVQSVNTNQRLTVSIPPSSRRQKLNSSQHEMGKQDDMMKITIQHDASLTPKPLGETVPNRPSRDMNNFSCPYKPALTGDEPRIARSQVTDYFGEVTPSIIPDISYRTASYSSVSGGGDENTAPFNENVDFQHDTTPQSNGSSKDESDWKTPSFGLDLLSTSATMYEAGDVDVGPKSENDQAAVDNEGPTIKRHRNGPLRPYHPTSLPSLKSVHTFSDNDVLNSHLQRSSTVFSQTLNDIELGSPTTSMPVSKSFMPRQPTLQRTSTFLHQSNGPLPTQPSFSSPLVNSVPSFPFNEDSNPQ